ncbi:unnamed protein product [Arctogadus glacialis]
MPSSPTWAGRLDVEIVGAGMGAHGLTLRLLTKQVLWEGEHCNSVSVLEPACAHFSVQEVNREAGGDIQELNGGAVLEAVWLNNNILLGVYETNQWFKVDQSESQHQHQAAVYTHGSKKRHAQHNSAAHCAFRAEDERWILDGNATTQFPGIPSEILCDITRDVRAGVT